MCIHDLGKHQFEKCVFTNLEKHQFDNYVFRMLVKQNTVLIDKKFSKQTFC